MTSQYLWDRVVGRDASIRAADADRERIADRLRKGHAEGRLDLAEFQERLEQCYQAKTLGDLGELVRDLPREAPPQPSLGWLHPSRWLLVPFAPILIGLLFISAAGEHHAFWLWIPVVFVCLRIGWWRQRRRWASARRSSDPWI